jgi:NAD(P)-dependent dehydrogenase (short-subunit alcohol dehydrogenase family)
MKKGSYNHGTHLDHRSISRDRPRDRGRTRRERPRGDRDRPRRHVAERRPGRLSIQGRLVVPLIGAYAASKWALEALAETLAVEAGHFGISVHVLQPGAVSSGGAERAQVYLDDANPYRPLLEKIAGFRAAPITVEEVADAVTGTVDLAGKAAFRIPVGEPATTVLSARKAAPEDVPFLAASLDW